MSNVNTQMEALDYTIKQYEQTRKNWKDAGGWGEYGEEGYQKLLQQRKDLQSKSIGKRNPNKVMKKIKVISNRTCLVIPVLSIQ